ncbi:MAG: 1-(5-phosphoribosyl)-5-((5-phosphoribosylamino)methylideneamino)imidazole-4-carboxamide isomerase [Hadesarchaea archaeon CG08_land_8_20_14_0_20_51_8]|nr:MAG: 1-(5-phosphoribosyl)-5-((5-phosphoribosylamino)methylideneamino)imidazole-4-carboxamide isomerase [Hadesarchaea archaeon CG08_land_8_20_14_0_20_51_8]
MQVIPSVDIMRGRCVQLVGGRLGTGKEYGDPVEVAQRWVSEGARCLHIIDLDATMGTGDNFERVAEVLASVRVDTQVGGGIRTVERACELLGIGATRVILGTAAMKNPKMVGELVKLAGGARVVVALDAKSGKVVIEGWRTQTEKTVLEFAKEFERMGVGALLFTSVDIEGKMAGIAAGEIRKLVSAVEIPVLASGGVGSLGDVRVAREAGAAGLVVGMALYEGKFTLKQAMEVGGNENW